MTHRAAMRAYDLSTPPRRVAHTIYPISAVSGRGDEPIVNALMRPFRVVVLQVLLDEMLVAKAD